ncbi:hypothetical protein ACFPVT_02825 [Corynebacterium choanae]|uniref:Uncharacterized protein n=1 Tax=Corynebacterium choanae TaxID=1862358 RepID=A0A3G6J3J6_9CORY|nr:hypothetical protein [Corynebacterium choanae]AZA12496.1 hypothetical protein CCHOA_00320 [Corynebacterium choanae]
MAEQRGSRLPCFMATIPGNLIAATILVTIIDLYVQPWQLADKFLLVVLANYRTGYVQYGQQRPDVTAQQPRLPAPPAHPIVEGMLAYPILGAMVACVNFIRWNLDVSEAVALGLFAALTAHAFMIGTSMIPLRHSWTLHAVNVVAIAILCMPIGEPIYHVAGAAVYLCITMALACRWNKPGTENLHQIAQRESGVDSIQKDGSQKG